jgi:nitroreductase
MAAPEGSSDTSAIVLEVLGTARAVRYFTPEPVPAEVVEQLVWAATRAPSPENSQDWAFICVDDRAILERIQAETRALAPVLAEKQRQDPEAARTLAGASHLATNLAEVPLVIFVCGRLAYPPHAPREQMAWTALYPAAQNLLVAARALGLGAAFTLLHQSAEAVVRAELGLPDEMLIAATIPVGFPASAPGPVRRRPVGEVLFKNRWRPEP